MIISGKTAIARGIIAGLRDQAIQAQPCGVDLTLRRVLKFTTAGVVDFDNKFRMPSKTEQISMSGDPKHLHLEPGNYAVEFNETVDMPLDVMGQVFVRSSLWRSGALVNAGVMDSGYKGAVGAMLQISNPHGLTIYENAKLAQMVFHEMGENVEGYSGTYQGATSLSRK